MDSTERPISGGLSRRQFVTSAGRTLVVGAIGLPALLEACGSASSGTAASAPPSANAAAAASTGPAPASGAKLPTYVPFDNGPKPDLPGNANGLDSAYFKFPADLLKSVPNPPGDGSPVSAFTLLTYAPPPPVDSNAAWQAVNKAINTPLSMQMVPTADYTIRLNALLAGSDLPDFIYNSTTTNPSGAIPSLPAFAKSKCADLTPYLSGDAIKDYPNLAHFSTYTWRSGVVEGKIYAIPSARPPIGTVMMYRSDLFEKAGIKINNAPANADEFKRMLQAVTRPQENQWGIAAGGTSYFALNTGNVFLGIFKVPTNWRMDAGGKLTKDFETEEYKAAIGYARDLWTAGVWHPNTPTYGGTANYDFAAGKFAMTPGVWGQYAQNWDLVASTNPNGRMAPMHPFSADGSKPVYLAGSGNFGLTLIKQQSSPERLKMLLRIANFFAAPFGTQEWLLNYYGVKDVDFTYDSAGSPTANDKGKAELTATWRYVTSPPYALFDSVRPQEFAQVSYAAEQAMLSALQLDPTLGLYSETAFSQGISAQTTLYSAASDIVQGRRQLSEWDSIVNDWRTKAGDKMRAEFQDAIQKAK